MFNFTDVQLFSIENLVKYMNFCRICQILHNMVPPLFSRFITTRINKKQRSLTLQDCIISLRTSSFGQSALNVKVCKSGALYPSASESRIILRNAS